MVEHYIAWWNVENLFDVENSPNRSSKLQRTLANELNGWTSSVLDRKLERLSLIISKMNNGSGPDILGVCEIEDEHVLKKLINHQCMPNRNYGIAHVNASDRRGIDVAFIYDADKYSFSGQVFDHVIVKRNATREIVQINLTCIHNQEQIILIGNHWPSRKGGALQSEPYRMMAGENLAYFVKAIIANTNPDIPIVICGDFNDEPFDRSITEYARATREKDRVISSTSNRLYNLMWGEIGLGKASHYFRGFPNMLDQFIVSKSIVKENKFRVKSNSVKVLDYNEMKKPNSKEPWRHGRPSSKYNRDGFSDHFPLQMILEEV